jgi:hypothetical protein
MEFLFDDKEAVRLFLAKLSPRVRQMRFGARQIPGETDWSPSHTVIVLVNGETVAMADCVKSRDGNVGNFSTVAIDGYGYFALIAIDHLRKAFPVGHIETSFVQPTEFLIEIARRWADTIYDQSAWAHAQKLIREHGFNMSFMPTPLAITYSNMRLFGVWPDAWKDEITRRQIALSCLSPGEFDLVTEKYGALPKPIIRTMGFEALAVPMSRRQKLTRILLTQDISENPKHRNERLLSIFQEQMATLKPECALVEGPFFRVRKKPHSDRIKNQ